MMNFFFFFFYNCDTLGITKLKTITQILQRNKTCAKVKQVLLECMQCGHYLNVTKNNDWEIFDLDLYGK